MMTKPADQLDHYKGHFEPNEVRNRFILSFQRVVRSSPYPVWFQLVAIASFQSVCLGLNEKNLKFRTFFQQIKSASDHSMTIVQISITL